MPKHCSNCGVMVKDDAKFCDDCGHPLTSEAPSQTTEPGGERVILALSNARKPKSFGRHDDYCIAITPQRMIFTRVTGDMLKEASKEASEKAKAEGKGRLRRWGSQLKAYTNFGDRYIGKTPQEVLAENKDNFAVDNSSIRRIKVKSKSRGEDADYYEFNVETNSGTHKFEFHSSLPKNFDELKKIYGDRVKKPGWLKLF